MTDQEKKKTWKDTLTTVGGYGLMGALVFFVTTAAIRNAKTPSFLDLESRSIKRAYNHVISPEENTAFEFYIAPWNLSNPNSIRLDSRQFLVLKEGYKFPHLKNDGFGKCSQEGILRPDGIDYYVKLNRDTSSRVTNTFYTPPLAVIEEKSSTVPKSLSGIFQENGLCNYRPI